MMVIDQNGHACIRYSYLIHAKACPKPFFLNNVALRGLIRSVCTEGK